MLQKEQRQHQDPADQENQKCGAEGQIKQVIPAEVYAADEGRNGVSGADIVTPVFAEETLGQLDHETTLKELFAGAGSRREG